MAAVLKVYGERNTGTNYLDRLIALNLDVVQLPGVVPAWVMQLQEAAPGHEWLRDAYFSLTFKSNLGWKHACVSSPGKLQRACKSRRRNNQSVRIVTVTKNPYSWLLSLYRRPYHQYWKQKPSFEEFVARPWRTTTREHAPRLLDSPVALWNLKNAAYLQISDEVPVARVRYEDLLAAPDKVIDTVAADLNLERMTSEFVNVESSTKNDGKDFDYYVNYYLAEQWRPELSVEALRLINEQLDERLLEVYGYQSIAPQVVSAGSSQPIK